MILQLMELVSLKSFFQRFLNDPVNWVAFIRRYNLDTREQKFWRDHLNLEHVYEGELEG